MLISNVEDNASPEDQKNLKWFMFAAVIFYGIYYAIDLYLEKIEMVEEKAAQELELAKQAKAREAYELDLKQKSEAILLQRKINENKCKVQKGKLLGKWKQQAETNNIYIEFTENSVLEFTDGNVPKTIWDDWRLSCRNMTLVLIRYSDGVLPSLHYNKLVYLDDKQFQIVFENDELSVIYLRVK